MFGLTVTVSMVQMQPITQKILRPESFTTFLTIILRAIMVGTALKPCPCLTFLQKNYELLKEYVLRPGKRIRPICAIFAFTGSSKDNEKDILADFTIYLFAILQILGRFPLFVYFGK